MKLTSLAFASFLLALASAGCAGEPRDASSSDELAADSVELPTDPCRRVLAPLSLGLADGAAGLAYAKGVSVTLTSATDTRLYDVRIDREGAAVRYEVELDNDSHSKCLLLSARQVWDRGTAAGPRSVVKVEELFASVPVTVSPSNDDCTGTVELLSRAAALSAVGATGVQEVSVSLESETEDRDYVAHVDGKGFVVSGTTFANDFDFALNLSNDSAFKCWVQEVTLKPAP